MKSLDSYKKGTCCPEADCYLFGTDAEPCWGQVAVVAEEYNEDDCWWIHACEGHEDYYYHSTYRSE